MFRIGEFSKLTQVSIRMLRYYDETGLLKPAEIDIYTNYRLYSSAQIPRLNKILFLRDLGFNVSEISIALEQWTDDSITESLEAKRLEIELKIKEEQDKLEKIELAKRDIQQSKIEIHYNVSIKEVPSYIVFSLRRIVEDYYAEGHLWKEIAAYAADNGLAVSDKTFTIYHDAEYKEKNVDIEVCAPVCELLESPNGFSFRKTEAVSHMASTMVHGPFENIAGAYLSFAKWLEKHNKYQMGSHSRQIVHRGPWNENDPTAYLTEIQVPLELI